MRRVWRWQPVGGLAAALALYASGNYLLESIAEIPGDTHMQVTDAKSAVRAAKEYLLALLGDESPGDLGLEELEYDDRQDVWLVTLGFSRPWDRNAIATFTGQTPKFRTYRVLKVRPDGEVMSFMRRAGEK